MRPFHVLIVFISCLLLPVLCYGDGNRPPNNEWRDFLQDWDPILFPLKHRFAEVLHIVTSDFHVNYSHDCRQQLISLRSGLLSGTQESYILFDSFTKTHAGFLGERLYDYGAYEQCLNSRFNGTSGRYVILHLHRPLPHNANETRYKDTNDSWISDNSKTMSALRAYGTPIALCLPDSCSSFDVQQIIESEKIKSMVYPSRLSLLTTESVNDVIVSDRPWLQVLSRFLFLTLIFTVILSTIVHYHRPGSLFLQSFDTISNTRKLFSRGKEENKNLTFFNGIRALYLILNIPTHLNIPHVECNFHPAILMIRAADSFSPAMKAFAMAAPHYVSSNVLMAACLSAIGWLPQMKQNPKKVNFLVFVVLRALRTLPVVLAMIVMTFTFPLVGHGVGPMMGHMQKTLSNKCYQFGWKDLLFISNFGSFDQMCLPVGWFMSADFQLYVFSFLYLGLLNSRPRLGFLLIGLQVVAGIVIHAHYLLSVNVHSVLKLWAWDAYDNINDYTKLFLHTANYIAVYPIGVVMGYLMVHRFHIRTNRPGVVFTILLLLCTVSLFSPVFLYDAGDDGNQLDFRIGGRFGEAIFGSLHRVVFVICYSAACLFLYSHPDFVVSRLLGCRFLTIVSRFSYSAFMTHPFVIMFVHSVMPDVPVSQTMMNILYLNVFVFAFLSGYLLYLSVEAPAMNLLKSMFSVKMKKRKSI